VSLRLCDYPKAAGGACAQNRGRQFFESFPRFRRLTLRPSINQTNKLDKKLDKTTMNPTQLTLLALLAAAPLP